MVKMNDKAKLEMQQPHSLTDSENSFVVIRRFSTDHPSSQFPSHVTDHSQFPNHAADHPSQFASHATVNGHSMQHPSTDKLDTLLPTESQNFSLASAPVSSDISLEEIQKKLQSLLQENNQLKETLNQNNLAMKEQYSTLVMWQDEVLKVHESHKQKFQETRVLIIRLKAENEELRKQIAHVQGKEPTGIATDAQLRSENEELKKKVFELQQKLVTSPRKESVHEIPSSKTDEELKHVVQQLTRQLETAERSRRQLTIDVEKLTAEKGRVSKENAAEIQALRERCTVTEHEKTELGRTVYLLQCNLEEMQRKLSEENPEFVLVDREGAVSSVDHNAKCVAELEVAVKSLTLQFEEERQRNAALSKELDEEKKKKTAALSKLQQVMQGSQPVTEGGMQFVQDMKAYEEKLQTINMCLDRQSERFTTLDSCLQNAAENISHWNPESEAVQVLRQEIASLKKMLTEELKQSQEKKHTLQEAQAKFANLFKEHQNLLLEWESYHKERNTKDRNSSLYYQSQARGFQEKIDSVTAQLMNSEDKLSQKDKHITELEDKVHKLEEAIAIFKAQVEVYQTDFNAERESREKLAGDKERLAEEVRRLQRTVQQLTDELETYQQSHFTQMQNQGSTSGGKNNAYNTIAAPGRGSTPARSSPGRGYPYPGPHDDRRDSDELQNHTRDPAPVPEVYEEEIPERKWYYCPKCNAAFKEIEPLQYHVETCLELTN